MLDPKLYSLISVYECGSFSAAAKRLSVTQPAVSQHIKALEQELKIKIFERSAGKLILTPQGKRALRCAQKMAGLERVLKQELIDSAGMSDHLTIGVTHTAESSAFVEALARLCAENAGITIKIITKGIGALYRMVKSYELDLAVVEGRAEDPQLDFYPLDTDTLVLAVAPEHPFAERETVTLDELRQEKMILRLPNSGTRNLFVAHLESHGRRIEEFNVILEIDNAATIKDLVRRGFGVSILPKRVGLEKKKKKKLALLPVADLSMQREINLVFRKDFSQKETLHEIVEAYNDTVRHYR